MVTACDAKRFQNAATPMKARPRHVDLCRRCPGEERRSISPRSTRRPRVPPVELPLAAYEPPIEYGGDLAGRVRFSREVACAIVRTVGETFPLSWRINAADGVEGGLEPDEALNVPVIAVGRLGDPPIARRVVRDGIADRVARGQPPQCSVNPEAG
jgi:hypothetical protein